MANCEYVLIGCGDPRLAEPIAEWLKRIGAWGKTAYRLDAGGVKDFALSDDTGIQTAAFKKFKVYMRLGPKTILLLNHSDCKAYDREFVSSEDEKNFHICQMKKARNLISLQYPNVSIKLVYGEKPNNLFKIVEVE
jgi:hypothetical protein